MGRGISWGWRKASGILLATLVIGAAAAGPASAASVIGTVNYTVWVSNRSDGTQPNSGAVNRSPVLSTSGTKIAFITNVALTGADDNGVDDVYLKDLSAGTTTLVSADPTGASANGSSSGSYVGMSDDGNYVVFASDASNLIGVGADTNNRTDIFRRNMTTGVTERVNVSDDESVVAAASDFFAVSANADAIAFIAEAAPDIANGQGVYVRHMAVGATQFVSATGGPGPIAMSGDGTTVAYSRFNETFCGFPTPPTYTIHHKVITGGPDTLVGTNSSNACDPSGVLGPDALSNDGKTLAFWSDGDTCCGGETGAKPRAIFAWNYDAYLNDNSNAVRRVSETQNAPKGLTWAAFGGTNANADSGGGTAYPKGSISNDGKLVAFRSLASNLDANAANGAAFVKNLDTGAIHAYSLHDSTYTAYPVVDTSLSPDGTVVGFTSSQQLSAADTNTGADVYIRSLSAPLAPAPLAPANVSLSADPSTYPGFSSMPSSAVPVANLPLDALSDIAGAPLRSVDLASTPLRSVPLRSVPLRSVPLRSVPLRSVTLSELPLLSGTWEAILATLSPNPFAGVPLQNITLDQVLTAFDAQPSATGLNSVTLGSVDLASTPLRSVSVASLLLGATPLRSVQVGATAPPNAFGDWCAILAGLGYSCTDLGLTADSPVLAADLAGVPLRSVPLRSVPLRSVPLRSVDIGSAPLRSVPLRSVKYTGDLGSMLLSKIRDRNADGTLGASNPALLIDCTDPDAGLFGSCGGTRTLTNATTADAFLAGKTFGDLVDHVDPADITGTLGDFIAAIIDTTSYPWESLELDGLQPLAGANARSVEYTAHFETTGAGTGTATVAVDLPPGFVYKRFSTVNHDDTYDEPVVTGGHLVWTVPGVTGGQVHDIGFDAYAPFDLAVDAPSQIMVTLNGTVVGAAGDPVDVLEDFETAICTTCITAITLYHQNDFPAGAKEIEPNTMVVSHISEPGDVDYFKLAVPPKGTRIQVRLGNHSTDADFDVAMINATTDATPLRSVPLRSVPLRSVPLTDNGIDATAADDAVSPETLDDIPNIEGAPLRSVGENRGTADELIATVSDADPIGVPPLGTEFGSQQYYLLQVTAYNGGSSNSPYVLYVKEYAPPPPPTCPAPRTYPFTGTLGSVPGSLPANLNTLFLVDQKRMGATYGPTAAQQVIDKLNTLAGRSDLGVTGVVYPVDGNSTAGTALDNWDGNPCSVDAANRAFNAVGEIVDDVRGQRPTLKNIVVVGGDDIIPMARVADYTQISNESDYGASLLLSSGTDKGTPLAASALTQNILTDDPLGDVDPIPWLDHALYVPDLAVGRMVETPAEIIGQVDSFLATGGVLSPASSLTTGYDFLSDGADAVNSALTGISPANKQVLINETWSKADVLAALYPAGGTTAGVVDMNAHYDHTRSLPALGNSTADETDLVTTAEIAANPLLTRRLLFTMGCHAGLSVPKAYTDVPAKDADWAQTYSAKQAAVYFANTGFGYGDTAAVALSEEVMRQFALRLDGSMTVGEAAVYAKQAYFGQLGAYGPYDEKAMQEATFYGLPMWKVGTGGTTPPPPANVTPTADATGVLSAPVSVAPSFTKKTSKGGGTFYTAAAAGTAASGLQVTQYRPIEPRLSVDVTPVPGSGQAHGVLITALASHDEAVVPAMARPVIDLTASEPPPPAGDVSFPTTFSNLTAFNTPNGERQHVVLLPGQFFRDAAFGGAGGIQRLFDSVGAEVKYSDSEDFLAPQLTNVTAALAGGQLTITLDAFDETQGNLKRVVVLVKDQSGAWSLHELTDQGGGSFSTGPFPVVGTQIEYFAQAQDGAGNVGVTTNKGRYFSGLPTAFTANGTPSLSLSPGQPTGANGWYRSNVSVALNGTLGVSYTKSVDGGAPTAYSSPVALTTDGAHSVKAVGTDGSSAIAVAVIDKTAPTLSATPDRAPNANGWYNAPVTFAVSCSDATSGVQVCPPGGAFSTEGAGVSIGSAFDFAGNSTPGPTVNLDMTQPTVVIGGVTNGAVYNGVAPDPTCSVTDALSGPAGCTGVITNGPGAGFYTYTATGKDKAGNTKTVSATYKASYLFSGFLQPVNDTAHQVDQTLSVFGAGSTVALKFRLQKQDGTFVQATATPTFITPVKIGPLGGAPVNEPTLTAAATAGGAFTWDAKTQTYSFNWKTDKKTMAGWYWRVGVLVDGQAFTVVIGLK